MHVCCTSHPALELWSLLYFFLNFFRRQIVIQLFYFSLTHNVGLMGLMEKRRFRKFVMWANEYDKEKPATHNGRPYIVIFVSLYVYMYYCLSVIFHLHNAVPIRHKVESKCVSHTEPTRFATHADSFHMWSDHMSDGYFTYVYRCYCVKLFIRLVCSRDLCGNCSN